MKQFLIQRWFLIALVAVLAIGICLARLLQPVTGLSLPGTNVPLRSAVVATVLFLMAFPLEASAMRSFPQYSGRVAQTAALPGAVLY